MSGPFHPWHDTVGYLLGRWRDEHDPSALALDTALGVETRRWTLGGYEPSPVALFTALLDACPLHPDGAAFVDIGAGKGRALLLAARHPFARVVGVETDATLVTAGQANLRDSRDPYRRCDDLLLLHADATAFAWPQEALCVYLYNPFDADTLDALLAGLETSLQHRPRPCALGYLNPRHDDVLHRRRWSEVVAEGEGVRRWAWFAPPVRG